MEGLLNQDYISAAFDADVSEKAKLVLLVLSCQANEDGITLKVKNQDLVQRAQGELKDNEIDGVIRELKSSGYLVERKNSYLLM